MATRLNDRKVQIVVVCLLAAVIAYNAIHFLGRKTGRRTFDYQDVMLEQGNVAALIPAWAKGDYESAASWGINPFTGQPVSPAAAGIPTAAGDSVVAPECPAGTRKAE